jgi:hypothetical protein
VKVSILLADKGTQNPIGTLNLLNVGWSQTQLQPAAPMLGAPGALTPPQVVAVFIEAEPAFCNRQIDLVLRLLSDGHPVELPGPAGPQEMRLQQPLTIPTPMGAPVGSPGTVNLMLELFPGLPLAPGVYEWRVTIDEQEHDDWYARFQVLPGPAAGPQFGAPPAG